jgi:hypothetical protein
VKANDAQLEFDFPELDPEAEEATELSISHTEARQISEAARVMFEQRMKTLTPGPSPASGRGENDASGRGEDEEEGPRWYEEYLDLARHGWPWRVAAYIAWAASPRAGRWPRTLEGLATEVLGLTGSRRIFQWRQKYPGINTTVAMLQAAPLFEHRRDVIEALVRSARTADYKGFNDRKLFLELTGDYVPRGKLEINRSGKALDLSEMSDEELAAMAGNPTPGPSPQAEPVERGGEGSDGN